jgi:hypothetical protein
VKPPRRRVARLLLLAWWLFGCSVSPAGLGRGDGAPDPQGNGGRAEGAAGSSGGAAGGELGGAGGAGGQAGTQAAAGAGGTSSRDAGALDADDAGAGASSAPACVGVLYNLTDCNHHLDGPAGGWQCATDCVTSSGTKLVGCVANRVSYCVSACGFCNP